MSYGCVVGTTYGARLFFDIAWEHEKSELKCVCFVLQADDYKYAVVDAGNITASETTEGRYYVECPFTFDETTQWGAYVWRETTATEDDVSYDGSTIPIDAIVAKLAEHSEKGEEATLEALRALRVPETDSNAFFPPKSVRADLIAGFDSDGNPTVGENCAQVKEIVYYGEMCKDLAAQCEAWVSEAESWMLETQAYYQQATTLYASTIAALNDANASLEAYASAATIAAATASAAEAACLQYQTECSALVKSLSGSLNVVVIQNTEGEDKDESYLPETGKTGNFYFVGYDYTDSDSDSGYREYVWSEATSTYICLGETNFSALKPATTSTYGLVRLGTDTTLVSTNAAVVGLNSAGQMLVPMVERTPTAETYTDATNTPGVVKLGSKFKSINTGSYVVGIGLSKNDDGLAFDLLENGSLVYESESVSSDTVALQRHYYLRVLNGSLNTRGVVYLCSSLSGYTDSQIDAIADTHAASIGLVVQGIHDYVDSKFTTARIEEYFDDWITSDIDELAQKFLNSDSRWASLTESVASYVVADTSVLAQLQSYCNTTATTWLTENITQTYVYDTFASLVQTVCDEHWDDELESYIDAQVSTEVASQVVTAVATAASNWFADETNYSQMVSDVVTGATSAISTAVAAEVKAYMDGEKSITTTSGSMTLLEYVEDYIESYADEKISEFDVAVLQDDIEAMKPYVKNFYVNTPTCKCVYDNSSPSWSDDSEFEITVDANADLLVFYGSRTDNAKVDQGKTARFYATVPMAYLNARRYLVAPEDTSYRPYCSVPLMYKSAGGGRSGHHVYNGDTFWIHVKLAETSTSESQSSPSTRTYTVRQNGGGYLSDDANGMVEKIYQVTFPQAVS